MAVAIANPVLLTDGDAAFLRVNNRLPAHALAPGEVRRAVNCRFEQGQPWPRYGAALDAWGAAGVNVIPAGAIYTGFHAAYIYDLTPWLTPGVRYFYRRGDRELSLAVSNNPSITTGSFVWDGNGFVRIFADGSEPKPSPFTVTGFVTRAAPTCGYARFNDPASATDNGVVLTDDWRDLAGEDGGRGRAWRILPGNIPVEIPLNGHDVWGTARLVQARDRMLLLRHGNERHYFTAAAASDALNGTFQLNCAPSWGVGQYKRVRFELATDGAMIYGRADTFTDTDSTADTLTLTAHGFSTGQAKYVTLAEYTGLKYVRVVDADTLTLYDTRAHALAGGATGRLNLTTDDQTGPITDAVPAAGNYYYAEHVTGNKVRFYTDASHLNQLAYSTDAASMGKFYIELAEFPAPFFGNGAPPLAMQANELGNTAFELGFDAVPRSVEITAFADGYLDAPNHGLVPGDGVTLTNVTFTASTGPFYAFPITEHRLSLHTSQTDALTGRNAVGDITGATDASLERTGASGLPMPPLREAFYQNGRVFGINERDTLVMSDPNDALHYALYQSTVPANQGEAGRANWLLPLGEDALLIGKDTKIILIVGISGAVNTWQESTLTSEFGGLAALAALNVGTDVWLFCRKGVVSVIRSVAGEKLAVTRPVSEDIPEDLRDVDWVNAPAACAAVWNNRYFLAVPMKSQETVVNNRVLVMNFLNRNLRVSQEVVAGDIVGGVSVDGPERDSWEGRWEGDLLTPYAFARLTVNGEERLTFATPNGAVGWFHEGWDDAGAALATELLTRGYFGGRAVNVFRGKLNWDSFQPKVTVSLVTAGVNEEETLAGFTQLEYDRQKYLTAGTPDYDPATSTAEQFDAPRRQDYSPTAPELLVARLDVHQNLTESFRYRGRGVAPQLRLANEQGSLRPRSVSLQAKSVGLIGEREA